VNNRNIIPTLKRSLSSLIIQRNSLLKLQDELWSIITRLDAFYSYNNNSDELLRLHSFSKILQNNFVKNLETYNSMTGMLGVIYGYGGFVDNFPKMIASSKDADETAQAYLLLLNAP
jgi:hypothetical protein